MRSIRQFVARPAVVLVAGLSALCGASVSTATAAPATGAAVAGISPSGTDIVGTDYNGDGRTDVAATGVSGWNTLPAAFSNGNGSFGVTNAYVGDFAAWAASPNRKVLAGDFNGDGRSDVALTGVAGWNTLPVAFSNGNGTFSITNFYIGDFAAWTASGAKVLTGDFNGDGRTDVAATGGPGWNTLPVAFSNGSGSFSVSNSYIGDFAAWTGTNAKVVTGDFNGDGRTDVAATGGPGWNTLPVAFSNGNGTFGVTNSFTGDFSSWSSSGAKVLTGDFNGDRRTDVALTGGPGWNTLPVAFSNGNGSFSVTNSFTGDFSAWTASGAKVLTGDFNGDGRTDVAATGGPGWNTLPVSFSNGNGSFSVTNNYIGDFAAWTGTNAKVVTGDFNGDGRSDVAATGGPGWNTLPVAFSSGNGSFGVTNSFTGDFSSWTSSAGAVVVSTPFAAAK